MGRSSEMILIRPDSSPDAFVTLCSNNHLELSLSEAKGLLCGRFTHVFNGNVNVNVNGNVNVVLIYQRNGKKCLFQMNFVPKL